MPRYILVPFLLVSFIISSTMILFYYKEQPKFKPGNCITRDPEREPWDLRRVDSIKVVQVGKKKYLLQDENGVEYDEAIIYIDEQARKISCPTNRIQKSYEDDP